MKLEGYVKSEKRESLTDSILPHCEFACQVLIKNATSFGYTMNILLSITIGDVPAIGMRPALLIRLAGGP